MLCQPAMLCRPDRHAASRAGPQGSEFFQCRLLVRNPGSGFDGEGQQPQPDVQFGGRQHFPEGRQCPLCIHVQRDIQCGPQRAGNHQAAQADNVKRTEPHFVQGAAAGRPQAGDTPGGIHEERKPVRLPGAAVNPRRCHPARNHPLPDSRRHGEGGRAGAQLGRGGSSGEHVPALIQLAQNAVCSHGLQLRPREHAAG